MNVQPAFRMNEQDEMAAFIDARRFATLVANGPDGLVAAHLPMIATRDASGRVSHLCGHVARNNPIIAVANGSAALAVFNGADAYVSPSWYPSKREHGKAVPTWNYVAVEAGGRLETFTDAATLRQHVSDLTDAMEHGRADPWALNDAPEAYVAQMLNGITGLKLAVDSLNGIRKLSQNRNEADRMGVQTALARSANENDRLVAGLMTQITTTRTTTEPTAR
jgi:transcriptional regulator